MAISANALFATGNNWEYIFALSVMQQSTYKFVEQLNYIPLESEM